jgi:hypothetical protein
MLENPTDFCSSPARLSILTQRREDPKAETATGNTGDVQHRGVERLRTSATPPGDQIPRVHGDQQVIGRQGCRIKPLGDERIRRRLRPAA